MMWVGRSVWGFCFAFFLNDGLFEYRHKIKDHNHFEDQAPQGAFHTVTYDGCIPKAISKRYNVLLSV